MQLNRYLYLVDLDGEKRQKLFRPVNLPCIDDAYIESFGKCATIEMPGGVLYIAAHSRCSGKMWRAASDSDENRPNVPLAAYRGFDESKAAGLAWSWLVSRCLP